MSKPPKSRPDKLPPGSPGIKAPHGSTPDVPWTGFDNDPFDVGPNPDTVLTLPDWKVGK